MLYDYLIYNCIFIVEEFIYVLFVDEVLYLRFFGVYKLEWEKKMSFVNQFFFFWNLILVIKILLMENLKLLDVQFGNCFIK